MKKEVFFLSKVIFQKKGNQQRKHKRERVNKHSERQTEGEETWKEKQGREKKEKAWEMRRLTARRLNIKNQ